MKKIRILSMMLLLATMLPVMVACGGDDNDDIVIVQEPQVSLNVSNLTDYGYFDGILYYKITSNSTNEIAVVRADKSAINVVIPNSVNIEGKTYKCTRIGTDAFEKCSNLTSITISNSVTDINYGAFYGCYKIEKVISLIENPFPIAVDKIHNSAFIIYNDVFKSEVYKNATLYVPNGTKSKYMNTEGWKKFKQIKEGNGK